MHRLDFDLARLALWIHLYNVPLELYFQDGLSYIASALGNPISMDSTTTSKSRLHFAKVCVEIDAKLEIPESVEVILANGQNTHIQVEVPWLPSRCKMCVKFGHSDKNCPNQHSSAPKKIWRKKTDVNSINDSKPTESSVDLQNHQSGSPHVTDLSETTDPLPGTVPVCPTQIEQSSKDEQPNFTVLTPAYKTISKPPSSPIKAHESPSLPKRGRGIPLKAKSNVSLKGSANRFEILNSIDESSPIVEVPTKKSRLATSGVSILLKDLKAKKKKHLAISRSSVEKGGTSKTHSQ
ncbi:uncharacterized protein LOC120203810 [Hibiscus syriacus]|uniref:uncharacterized protein LOC120203810 n=1 Tax=Hibiscus syriacus TaxID=106335 RepID=UPI0019204596|nr:uncharacterized protein LOC120203810 [Hibiscus syriacus]